MARGNQFLNDLVALVPPLNRLRRQRDQYARSAHAASAELENLRLQRVALQQEFGRWRLNFSPVQDPTASVGSLEDELDFLRAALADRERLLSRYGDRRPWVPNGHFYSPIAPIEDLKAYFATAVEPLPRTLPDIDLREEEQFKFLEIARGFYADLPFRDHAVEGLRYSYLNQAFSYTDAIMLNSMIRHVRPSQVVEVGSGYSSCMLLDTNEIWFNNLIDCSFIEPYPKLLNSLLKTDDQQHIKLYSERVQDTPISIFESLTANDILFIDSTHVSRVGSDVNHILFNILPALAPGVVIHFHDIFYPFEYLRDWIEEGRAWNEAYLLRAFLMRNKNYEIIVFNSFMNHFYKDYMNEYLPLCQNSPGGSIWLRKIA